MIVLRLKTPEDLMTCRTVSGILEMDRISVIVDRALPILSETS